jgi:hypothetical protein
MNGQKVLRHHDLRFASAKELAPFVHPKLSSIEARVGGASHGDRLQRLLAALGHRSAMTCALLTMGTALKSKVSMGVAIEGWQMAEARGDLSPGAAKDRGRLSNGKRRGVAHLPLRSTSHTSGAHTSASTARSSAADQISPEWGIRWESERPTLRPVSRPAHTGVRARSRCVGLDA